MNVLLIQPSTRHMIHGNIPAYVSRYGGHLPPLGLMYLASALQKKTDTAIKILDASLPETNNKQIKEKINQFQPGFVGITVTSFTLIDALNMAHMIKAMNPDIHICLGGPHPSIYPRQTLNLPDIDSVIIGEGEITLPAPVTHLKKSQELEGIRGLYFKTKSKTLVTNPRREFNKNIDSIALPDRRLVDLKKYQSAIGEKFLFTTILASRGCPYGCSFCYHAFGKKVRTHSIPYMLNEIKECLDLGIREFWYFDDHFIINRQHIEQFCRRLIAEKLNIRWHIRTRPGSIDDSLAHLLAQAGCRRISMGVESSSPHIQKILKKEFDLADVRQQINRLKSHGFDLYLDFMIGSPEETKQDILNTIEFALELDPEYAQFSLTTPYPATELYRTCLAKGVIKSDEWEKFASTPDPLFKPPPINEHLSPKELQQMINYAYRKFYFRCKYICKRFFRVQSFSDFIIKAKAGFQVYRNVKKK